MKILNLPNIFIMIFVLSGFIFKKSKNISLLFDPPICDCFFLGGIAILSSHNFLFLLQFKVDLERKNKLRKILT